MFARGWEGCFTHTCLQPANSITAPLPSEAYLHVQSIHGVPGLHVSAGAAVILQVTWANPRHAAEPPRKAQQRGEVIEDRVHPGEAQAEAICRKSRRSEEARREPTCRGSVNSERFHQR